MKTLVTLSTLLAALTVSITANAADGCKFLLCMGAPNPMGVSECVSTVKEVMRDLRKGRGLPTCKLSNGQDSKSGGTWVDYHRATPTPQCPEGYRQGSDGVAYHRGAKPSNIHRNPFTGELNISSGYISEKFNTDSKIVSRLFYGDGYKKRVCVKGSNNGFVPAYRSLRKDKEFYSPRQEWFDDVVVMTPDNATYEFTFYVDNQPFSKHRF